MHSKVKPQLSAKAVTQKKGHGKHASPYPTTGTNRQQAGSYNNKQAFPL